MYIRCLSCYKKVIINNNPIKKVSNDNLVAVPLYVCNPDAVLNPCSANVDDCWETQDSQDNEVISVGIKALSPVCVDTIGTIVVRLLSELLDTTVVSFGDLTDCELRHTGHSV